MDVLNLRNSGNYSDTLDFVKYCKKAGNESIKNGNYNDAIHQYEKGLSVLHWIEDKTGSSTWKKEVNFN